MKQSKLFDDQLLVITGAAGFIGSGTVRYLNDKGIANLLLVDDLKFSEKWKNLVGKSFYDIISRHDLMQFLFEKKSIIAGILHLGACSDTAETNGDYLLKNNYRYSIKLAEFALLNDIPFVYASSAATYGDGSIGFFDNEHQLKMLRPLNRYGFSKHLFDLWLLREGVLDKVIGLKYFNVFGPNEYHKKHMSSWILKMSNELKKTNVVKLFRSNDPNFKDGEQCRDFIYVKDAVRMTCNLLDGAFQGVSGIFNIGTGKASTWKELALALFKAINKKPEIEFVDMPDIYKKQYQNYTCADMCKYNSFLQKSKNLFQTSSLDETVKEYVQQYILKGARW